MTPKIRKKRSIIIVMFATLGIAINKALTATLSYSFLLINLKSLNILNILNVVRLSERGVKARIVKIMIIKSKIFQELLK
jgi:hypothetical protein